MARILEEARVLLAEVGYENVAMGELARRCGLSEASIYKYFESKRELFVKVTERWLQEQLAVTPRSYTGMSPLDALRHAVGQHFHTIRRDPELTKFLLTVVRADTNYRALPVYALNKELLSQISAVLQHFSSTGEFVSEVPARVMKDLIFGAIEHRTWSYIRTGGNYLDDRSADDIARLLFFGLKPREAPQGRSDGLARGDDAVARLERVARDLARSVDKLESMEKRGA